MSIVVTKDVFCDECSNWTGGLTGDFMKRTVLDAACIKGRFGRYKRDGVLKDLCYDCQTEAERLRTYKRQEALRVRAAIARGERSWVAIGDVPMSEVSA